MLGISDFPDEATRQSACFSCFHFSLVLSTFAVDLPRLIFFVGMLNLETQWIKVDIGDGYKAERYGRQRWGIFLTREVKNENKWEFLRKVFSLRAIDSNLILAFRFRNKNFCLIGRSKSRYNVSRNVPEDFMSHLMNFAAPSTPESENIFFCENSQRSIYDPRARAETTRENYSFEDHGSIR